MALRISDGQHRGTIIKVEERISRATSSPYLKVTVLLEAGVIVHFIVNGYNARYSIPILGFFLGQIANNAQVLEDLAVVATCRWRAIGTGQLGESKMYLHVERLVCLEL